MPLGRWAANVICRWAAWQPGGMAAESPKPLKMTIYVPLDLVDALDALKVADQRDQKVSRNMGRPDYVVWSLRQFVEQRKRRK